METLQFTSNRQNIVKTNINYTYEIMQQDINMLKMGRLMELEYQLGQII